MVKRRGGKGKPDHAPRIADPLAVIPFRPENVDLKYDSQQRAHLRVRVPLTGFLKRVADRCGYDYTKKSMLDEYGTAYMSLADGQADLKTIIAQMATQFGKTPKEMEAAVMLFTKTLMTKQLIALKVPESAQMRNKA